MLAVVALLSYTWISVDRGVPVAKGDGEGYYAYLPAVFVDGDLRFGPERERIARRSASPERVGLSGFIDRPGGRALDKFPFGPALVMSPFFLAGHAAATAVGQDADGYSPNEQALTGLAAGAAALLGLAALRALLLRWFRDRAVGLTLAGVLIGGGLLHWAAFDASYHPAYAFLAGSLLLLATMRYLERPGPGRAALAGLAASLLLSTRSADFPIVIGVALVALLAMRSRTGERPLATLSRDLAVAGGCAAAGPLLQVFLWHHAGGIWTVNPYSLIGQQFEWTNPHPRALFALNPHGLLPYTPIVLVAVSGFVLSARRCGTAWGAGLTAGVALQAYLIIAFPVWWYGDGFGSRPFIDLLPLLAIPLAARLDASLDGTRRGRAVLALSAAFVAMTASLMHAYWTDELSHGGSSAHEYLSALVP